MRWLRHGPTGLVLFSTVLGRVKEVVNILHIIGYHRISYDICFTYYIYIYIYIYVYIYICIYIYIVVHK